MSTEITVEKAGYEDRADVMIIIGGDDRDLSWTEYLDDYEDRYKPHVIALKKFIEENGLLGMTGAQICNYTTWKFSDGTKWGFTWRAWGDLMQAIVNKREGYMTYYM